MIPRGSAEDHIKSAAGLAPPELREYLELMEKNYDGFLEFITALENLYSSVEL